MLCVIAKLDELATETLAAIQKIALSDFTPSNPLHGHITLATYIGDNETEFVQFCKHLFAGLSSFTVEYKRIEVLEGNSDSAPIIVASPERAGLLEEVHRRIAAAYDSSLNQWTQTGSWYPHTTLLYKPGVDLHPICCKMAASFVPFSTQIRKIEFSRVLESGYDIIDQVELPAF